MMGNDKVKPAPSREAATHRYPTNIYWGEGYFGDLMRYVVANSVIDVLDYARPFGIELTNIQVADPGSRSGWRFAS